MILKGLHDSSPGVSPNLDLSFQRTFIDRLGGCLLPKTMANDHELEPLFYYLFA